MFTPTYLQQLWVWIGNGNKGMGVNGSYKTWEKKTFGSRFQFFFVVVLLIFLHLHLILRLQHSFYKHKTKRWRHLAFTLFFPLRFSSFHKAPKKNLGKGRVLHFCSMMMATTMAVLLNNGCLAWQWREHGCCKNTRPKKNTKWQWQQGHGCCRLNTRPKHTPTHTRIKKI